MNDQLNIETILGYVANDNPLRASKDGRSFEEMIPVPTWTEVTIKRNGSVNDTVNEMKQIIEQYYWQTAQVAPLLKGRTLDETCHNIWDFLFYHIKYNEDTANKEELRTFSRTFANRKEGVDCDDFSIACGSILRFLNIPFYIRIARYAGKDYFQHVYVVVPIKDKEYITIDGVLDEYDAEKTPVETKDFLVMNNRHFSGIDISVLGGIADETLNELSGILSGIDFKGVNELEGLGTVAGEEEELGAIRNYLIRTRNMVARRPDLISDTQNPESFLGMVDYALKYWNTDKRDEALGILESEENRINELEGLGGLDEGHESVDLFYGLSDEGTFNVLGKAKTQKKFFTKVKQAAKKAGQGIKKASKAVVRYNPLTASIRASVLLALKVNLFKVSSKLKWGYLTRQEAQAQGFDLNEWSKVKTQLAKAENMFVNTLQGKAENFKRAILTGRAGGLSGSEVGLGVVVAATAAASTAAAVPFITAINNLLKNINFSKLVAGVSARKMARQRKKAEADIPTKDGETAMPEGGQASDQPPEGSTSITDNSGSEFSQTSASVNESEQVNNPSKEITTTQQGDKTVISTKESGESSDVKTESASSNSSADNSGAENTNSNPDNLPANTGARGANVPATTENPDSENLFTKSINWVKENPKTSVLIGAGAAFLIYELVKSKPRQALSGTRKGKMRKGKAKKHPPQVVTGVGKKQRKPRKRKKSEANKKFKL